MTITGTITGTIIGVLVLLGVLAVGALLAAGRRKKRSTESDTGRGYKEPQDEGTTLPLARDEPRQPEPGTRPD